MQALLGKRKDLVERLLSLDLTGIIQTAIMTEYRNGDERFRADFRYKAKRHLLGPGWDINMYEISYPRSGMKETLLRSYGAVSSTHEAIQKLKQLEEAHPHKSTRGTNAANYFGNIIANADNAGQERKSPMKTKKPRITRGHTNGK